MVAQLPHRVGERVVVRRHRAALAGRDDLARMEAEAAGHAEAAARAAAVAARRARRPRPRAPAASGSSCSAHGRPKRCTASSAFVRGPTSTFAGVDVHRLRVDVDEHGREARERDDVRRRREGVRRHEHLVARLEAEREHRECSAAVPERDGERVLDLARPRELGLELAHLRAHREHPALEDLARPRRARRSPTSGQPRRRRGVFRPVPRDRLLEAVVELDPRLPAEEPRGPSRRSGCAARRRRSASGWKTISPVAPISRLMRCARS